MFSTSHKNRKTYSNARPICPHSAVYQTITLTTVHYFGLLEQNEINENNNHGRRGLIEQKSELSENGCIVFGTSLGGGRNEPCSVQYRSIGPSVGECSARRVIYPQSQPQTDTLATSGLCHHVVVLRDVSGRYVRRPPLTTTDVLKSRGKPRTVILT